MSTIYGDDMDTDDLELEEDELEPNPEPVRPARGRRTRADSVPDAPVENATDIPLLVHAGTGKANTITYLKITRLDGQRGVRGLKGQIPPESTYETVARRFGNGTYKIEGCNHKHRVLAREEALEISIPGFDDDGDSNASSKQPLPQQSLGNGAYTLHGMKLIHDMSQQHAEVVAQHATASNEQVQTMANKTMEMLTAFTAAQRESERESYRQAQTNQQTFFASLLKMQESSHVQQMQMLTAIQDQNRRSQADPLQMIEVFMSGLKTAGELGGGDSPEPWLVALKEGGGMLSNLARLATANPAGGMAGMSVMPPRALQARAVAAPPAPPAPPAPTPNPAQGAGAGSVSGKTRLPFKREEIRGISQLRAQLRKRGIPLDAFLAQTTEYYRTAPDAELFLEDEDEPFDGPIDESDNHAAARPEHPAT